MKRIIIIGLIGVGCLFASDKVEYLNEQEIEAIESIQKISKATDKLIGLSTNNYKQILNNSKELLKLRQQNNLLKKTITRLLNKDLNVTKSNKVRINSKVYSNINNFIDN